MGDYRPRLSIELSEEQHKSLQQLIPWGVKNQLFSIIVDQLIALMQNHGQVVIALVLEEKIKINKLININEEDLKSGLNKRS